MSLVAEHAHLPVVGYRFEMYRLRPKHILPGFVWMDKHGHAIRGVVESVEQDPHRMLYRITMHGGFSFVSSPDRPLTVIADVERVPEEHRSWG